jgi:5-methylcytosine-specific restriction endonuclease McrA
MRDDGSSCGNLKWLRERVFYYSEILKAFDRQEGYCMECGDGPLEKLVTHHIKPRSLGGTNEASNLEILCSQACHGKREKRSRAMYGPKK